MVMLTCQNDIFVGRDFFSLSVRFFLHWSITIEVKLGIYVETYVHRISTLLFAEPVCAANHIQPLSRSHTHARHTMWRKEKSKKVYKMSTSKLFSSRHLFTNGFIFKWHDICITSSSPTSIIFVHFWHRCKVILNQNVANTYVTVPNVCQWNRNGRSGADDRLRNEYNLFYSIRSFRAII